jgi:hypothetical protein
MALIRLAISIFALALLASALSYSGGKGPENVVSAADTPVIVLSTTALAVSSR